MGAGEAIYIRVPGDGLIFLRAVVIHFHASRSWWVGA